MTIKNRFFNLGMGTQPGLTEGDIDHSILWNNDHGTHVGGVVVVNTGLSADTGGRYWLRSGSVLVPNDAQANTWRVATSAVDIAGDPGDPGGTPPVDPVAGATAVLIAKGTWIIPATGGRRPIGAYTRGSFIASRMPSLADNDTRGLETAAQAALQAHGFRFAEAYGSIN